MRFGGRGIYRAGSFCYTPPVRKIVLACVCAAFLSFGLPAEEEKAEKGWSFGNNLAVQVNPLGLTMDTRLWHTWPLFSDKQGILWNTARVDAGLHNSAAPAYNTLSVFVRVEPLAFFDFLAHAGLRTYYDVFGYGYTPLESYGASWDARDRKDSPRYEAAALRYGFTATLKGAVGPFVFGSATSLIISDMFSPRGGKDYYYDPTAETALALFDGFLTNDSLVLYTFSRAPVVRAGLLHGFLYVPGSEYSSRRLCFLGRIEGGPGKSLKLFGTLLCGVFLKDRYYSWKTGKINAAVQTGIAMKL